MAGVIIVWKRVNKNGIHMWREGNVKMFLVDKTTEVISRLRKRDVTILPSDKGDEFCVINDSKYVEAVESHLADQTMYKKVTNYDVDEETRKINLCWYEVCRRRNISRHIQRHFRTTIARVPRFYGLVKTHKSGNEVKVKPIVNGTRGPC